MTDSLAQQLFAQLQGDPMRRIAQQLGTDPQQTAGAVGAALPLLFGALGRNSARPQGADDLFGALQRDHAGTDLGSVLGSAPEFECDERELQVRLQQGPGHAFTPTNFERKYVADGRVIRRYAFRRRPRA